MDEGNAFTWSICWLYFALKLCFSLLNRSCSSMVKWDFRVDDNLISSWSSSVSSSSMMKTKENFSFTNGNKIVSYQQNNPNQNSIVDNLRSNLVHLETKQHSMRTIIYLIYLTCSKWHRNNSSMCFFRCWFW